MNTIASFSSVLLLGSLLAACATESGDGTSPSDGTGAVTGSGGANGSGGLAGTGATASGTGAASSTGASSGTGATNGSGDSAGLPPVACDDPFEDPTQYGSALPLLTSNPGAGLVLFVDFDGGTYSGTSYPGYYTGTEEQAQNIALSFNYLKQYYAMFDLSVTTDASQIGAGSGAENWGWIVVTPDYSGGVGKYGSIGQLTEPRSVCSDTTMTNSDRSRRIVHELGHNMDLYHDGLFENGTFCKFEDCATWDGKYGSIMGGGGEGERNGWGLALFDPDHGGTDDASNMQDEMAKVRKVVREKGLSTANDGWSTDDHPDAAPSPLCLGDGGALYRIGVLNSPDDVDSFALDWPGGPLSVTWSAPGVSAALVDLDIYQGGQKVGDESVANASAATYEIRVKSNGDYGAVGYYRIDVE
jgi:hypothetical protein